jgi:ABC-type molybdate transport system substrate-binding protein
MRMLIPDHHSGLDQERRRRAPPWLLALGLLLMAAACQRRASAPAPDAEPAPAVPARKQTTLISMLASTDTRAFLSEMALAFGKRHPEYEVTVTYAGSLDAAARVLEGRQNPLVFSPADSRIIDMLKSDAEEKHLGPLFDPEGAGAPQSLFTTPLVLVAWEDRALALEKAGGGPLTWTSLRKAVAAPKGWASLGGQAAWGRVKLDQSDPTQSNSGMQALVAMAMEHKGGPGELSPGDVAKKDRQAFIAAIEKAVAPKFPPSTEAVVVEMQKQGPAAHDLSIVYESSAVSLIEGATRRWGKLRVYYPTPSLLSDHPIALIRSAAMSPAERAGALAWIEFLRTAAAQRRALAHGFRPSHPEVPPTAADPRNPFHRHGDSGLKIAIPPAAPMPERQVIRSLLAFWSSLHPR